MLKVACLETTACSSTITSLQKCLIGINYGGFRSDGSFLSVDLKSDYMSRLRTEVQLTVIDHCKQNEMNYLLE